MSGAKPALVIQPIDFDAAMRVVETFSADRKIPSMVYPDAPAVGERKSEVNPVSPVSTPAPVVLGRDRRSLQRIPVELPLYVFDDIKQRALDQRCSARHVIMKALRAYGLHIADEDMPEDGRRLR